MKLGFKYLLYTSSIVERTKLKMLQIRQIEEIRTDFLNYGNHFFDIYETINWNYNLLFYRYWIIVSFYINWESLEIMDIKLDWERFIKKEPKRVSTLDDIYKEILMVLDSEKMAKIINNYIWTINKDRKKNLNDILEKNNDFLDNFNFINY